MPHVYCVRCDRQRADSEIPCPSCRPECRHWSTLPAAEVDAMVRQFKGIPVHYARKALAAMSPADRAKKGGLELDDLIAEGAVALLRAARQFDRRRGVKPITLFMVCVRNRILGIVHERAKLKTPAPASLATALDGDEFDPADHRQAEPPDGAIEHEAEIATNAKVTLLRAMIDELPPRWGQVIRARYFEGLPLRAVAREYGCSRERVRQIQERALLELRDLMSWRMKKPSPGCPDEGGVVTR